MFRKKTVLRKKTASPTMLLVDDDPVFVKIMEALARKEKFSLISFSSPEEACKKIAGIEFDVAIFDYDLGRFTGVQLARMFNKTKSSPVLIVSANLDIETRGWPQTVKTSLSKSLGPYQVFIEALKAYDTARF